MIFTWIGIAIGFIAALIVTNGAFPPGQGKLVLTIVFLALILLGCSIGYAIDKSRGKTE